MQFHSLVALSVPQDQLYCVPRGGQETLDAYQLVCEEVQDCNLQAAVLEACCNCGVWLAWLDAKMPVKQFEQHHSSQTSRQEIRRLLNMFDLILPETDAVW